MVAYKGMDNLYKKRSGYAGITVTRPQTIGYSLADSPVGLAAWFYDKFVDWTYSGGEPERSLTKDEMLDGLTLYIGPAARGTSVRCRVLVDGQPPGAAHGIDIDAQGNGTVAEQRLDQLIREPMPIADRQFEIEFPDPGVEVFAFTFG
jgi:hypothetical protein